MIRTRSGFRKALLVVVIASVAGGCAARPRGCACAPDPCAVRCTPAAHASAAAFVATHLSAREWGCRVLPEFVSRPEAVVPVVLAGAAILAVPFDDDIVEALSGTLGTVEAIGDVGAHGLVVASLAIGAFRPGEGRTAASQTWNQAEAIALTYGAVEGLKAIVGRQRPGGSSDRDSFPSGHTAEAFCAATLLMRNSGPRLGIPAYAVAAITGLSRIESGRHSPSDVLAGAALGTLIAQLVDILHFGDGVSGDGICGGRVRLEVVPTSDGRETVGIGVDL